MDDKDPSAEPEEFQPESMLHDKVSCRDSPNLEIVFHVSQKPLASLRMEDVIALVKITNQPAGVEKVKNGSPRHPFRMGKNLNAKRNEFRDL